VIEPTPGNVSEALQAHVARIVGAAEEAAAALQREIEQEATRRAAQVTREALEDAARVRAEAQAQAQTYLDDMRLRVDTFASARVDRISELTDTLLAAGEAIQARLHGAVDLQVQLRDLLAALGTAARSAAAEGARPGIRLPAMLDGGHPGGGSDSAGAATGAPSTAGPQDADAGAHVQRIAQDLPRAGRHPSTTEDQPA
jgi:hypothetical protein